MKYSIALTTITRVGVDDTLDHYVATDGIRRMYCDALQSAEACCKYILANHRINEILALGSYATHSQEDILTPTAIKDGKDLYGSDVNDLTSYGLLRYRLAQFRDELCLDDKGTDELLNEDEAAATTALLNAFFEKKHTEGSKFNRFFDLLSHSKRMREELNEEMEELPGYAEHPHDFQVWAKHYLYEQLKDSYKMELLEGNEHIKMSFVRTDDRQKNANLVHVLGDKLWELVEGKDEPIELDFYLCLANEDANATMLVLNIIELAKMIPGVNLNIAKIVTVRAQGEFTSAISDVTSFYGASALQTAMRVFMHYGKTDLLAEYWKNLGIENTFISSLINAVRIIDVGISLCDIDDIDRGVKNLRNVLENKDGKYGELGNSSYENLFAIVVESIRRDMGSLLANTENSFIDLVKWTYQKGFLQQCLTLIEARGPQDIVDRGIYYYCDSDESEERTIKILGQVYYDLKPYEKFKLDDVSHYFVKSYGRNHVGRTKSKDEHQRRYAQLRIEDLDAPQDDGRVLKALTRCTDREALKDLLYSYYHLSDVRNATAHAETSDGMAMREDSDVSTRLELIDQALRFFIKSYDRVSASLTEPAPVVRQITTADLFAYSRTLNRPPRGPRPDRRRDDQQGDQEQKADDKESDAEEPNADNNEAKPANNGENDGK